MYMYAISFQVLVQLLGTPAAVLVVTVLGLLPPVTVNQTVNSLATAVMTFEASAVSGLNYIT